MFGYRKNNVAAGDPEILQIPATAAESFVVGEALKLSSGKVTKASGTDAPEYISAEKKTAANGDTLSCYLVAAGQEYETTLSASGQLTVGVKYTIASDGGQITATSTSGKVEVVSAAGSAAGDKVIVRF